MTAANDKNEGAGGEAPAAPPPIGGYGDSLALVRGYQASGDRALLERLLERYYDRVRRIARIRMGSRLHAWAESDDLVQDTFTAAFDRIGDLDLVDHSSLIRYLSRVLENQIRGALENLGAQKRTPTSGRVVPLAGDPNTSYPEPVSRRPSPVDEAQAKELAELYDRCVESLDPTHREVLLMREYAEASWAEIRDAMGRPTEHAARLLYSRAQIKLAESLRRRLTSNG